MTDQIFRIVVCAALVQDGQVLLQLRAAHKAYGAGEWFFPGGKSNWGESAQECTARECREELGVEINPADVEILSMTEVIRPGRHDIMVYTYCTKWQGEPENLDTKNTDRIEWFPVNHVWKSYKLHEPQGIMALLTNKVYPPKSIEDYKRELSECESRAGWAEDVHREEIIRQSYNEWEGMGR